jgi:hypothetical protein
MGSYPRFCRPFLGKALSKKGPAVIYLTPGPGVAAPDLPGVTRLYRHRCDETESLAGKISAPEPGPLALLPVARSPSRARRRDRWWALTPPVRPLPAPTLLRPSCEGRESRGTPAGILSVAVVVRTRLSPACPHLLFHGATLSRSYFWISQKPRIQDWESGSSSGWQCTPSDGSPIYPPGIIPREWPSVKAFSASCLVHKALFSTFIGCLAFDS